MILCSWCNMSNLYLFTRQPCSAVISWLVSNVGLASYLSIRNLSHWFSRRFSSLLRALLSTLVSLGYIVSVWWPALCFHLVAVLQQSQLWVWWLWWKWMLWLNDSHQCSRQISCNYTLQLMPPFLFVHSIFRSLSRSGRHTLPVSSCFHPCVQ